MSIFFRKQSVQLNLQQDTWLGQCQGQGKIWYCSYLNRTSLLIPFVKLNDFFSYISSPRDSDDGGQWKGQPTRMKSYWQPSWVLPLSWKGETCHPSQPPIDFFTPSRCFYISLQLSQIKRKLFQGYDRVEIDVSYHPGLRNIKIRQKWSIFFQNYLKILHLLKERLWTLICFTYSSIYSFSPGGKNHVFFSLLRRKKLLTSSLPNVSLHWQGTLL